MLNLNICARCPRGDYSPSRVSKEGEMTCAPAVDCDLAGAGLLLCDSELPKGCLYVLEQKLTEDEAWSNMESVLEEFYKESVI
jgi:hypothetical protein